ncbi:MAG: hypothetical protein GX896_05850 [Clostridiales bacterium]|nr:hypothetical protein [Clostridiales bacterium]
MKNRFSFRAYIKEEKVMRQVSAIEYDEETIITGCYINEKCYRNGDTSCYNFDDVELMQCTGVTDKNGKLIYEGDIFKNPLGAGCGIVKYGIYRQLDKSRDYQNVDCGFYVFWNVNFSFNTLRTDLNFWASKKVIGNIYENPELVQSSVEE